MRRVEGSVGMAVVSARGIAKPYNPGGGETYAIFGDKIPVLHSFRLTYPNSDHEINLIQVLAGGSSHDLTPAADLNPSTVPDGKLSVLLQDASPDEEEFGYYVAHSTLQAPGPRRYQIRDVGCVGACRRAIPREALVDHHSPSSAIDGHIIALAGFKLYFIGLRDRQLDHVGVWIANNEIRVTMRDRNGTDIDDTFGYLVDFVVIPTFGLNVTTGVETGSGATTYDARPLSALPSRADFFLTGWDFNFEEGDHRIRDIGVVRNEEQLTALYSDTGGDDPFAWRIGWAHIAPRVISGP